MALATVHIQLPALTERLVCFVEELAGYVAEHGLDDELAEIVARTKTDLELIRLEQLLSDVDADDASRRTDAEGHNAEPLP